METKTKHRCQGKRHQRRRGVYAIFNCTRLATGSVETHVGTTNTYNVCNDDECYHSISCGYPAQFTPFKK